MMHPKLTLVAFASAVALAGAADVACATTQATARNADAQEPRDRVVLLREGVELVEARGRVVRDPSRGAWVLHVEDSVPNVGGFEFTLLPCARLAEMLPAVNEPHARQPIFEVTGTVFTHADRNYLLPVHFPQVVDFTPQAEPAVRPARPDMASGETGSIAESIVGDLERAVGPLAHTSDLGARAAESPSLARDGTMFMSRRGRITRNGGGAYLFVLDADAEGLADPPLVLLPCRLLERIETHLRKGESEAVLLSGRVYAFQGVNYLLPTVFRIAKERTPLMP